MNNMKYAFLGAALLAASTIVAQQTETTDRPVPRDPRAQERRIERGPVLTPEEREKVKEITDKNRAQQRELAEKLRKVRTELDALARADKIDESAVMAKAAELGKVEGQIALLRGRQYQELKAALPEEKLQAFRPGSISQLPPSAALRERLQSVPPRQGRPATPPNRPVPGQPKPEAERQEQ